MPTTEELLAEVNRKLGEVIASGKPLTALKIDPYTQEQVEVLTEDGRRYNELVQQREVLNESFSRGGVSPSAAASNALGYAQIAERQADRAEESRQFDQDFEQQAARDAESVRKSNLTATLDLLEGQIKMGELDANEATNRITAAVRQADIQNETLKNFAPYAVAPGQQFFPNAGPTGPLAEAVKALGLNFPGFETGGTYGIDPNAMTAPIQQAVGPSAVPGVNSAIQAAAAALAGYGVVPATPDGRQQRPPSQGVSNAAAAMGGR